LEQDQENEHRHCRHEQTEADLAPLHLFQSEEHAGVNVAGAQMIPAADRWARRSSSDRWGSTL
jgi:hypothetical protein